MVRASQTLAQSLPTDVTRMFVTLAGRGEVALSTLHHRAHGRRLGEQKAQSQQFLTTSEEKAIVKFILQVSGLGQPVRIKYLPSLAFGIARRQSTKKPPKVPGKNWACAFERRHPALKARVVRAPD